MSTTRPRVNENVVAHDEVDVEEEADVKEEVCGTGDDKCPQVDGASRVDSVDDEQRHSGVPDAHCAQYRHRRQYVLVLTTPTHTHTHTHC